MVVASARRSLILWLVAVCGLILAARAAQAAESEHFVCPDVAPIPSRMGIETRYSKDDPTYSILDPQRVEQQREVRARITRPVALIVTLADSFVAEINPNRRAALAACLQRHFLGQARERAMVDAATDADFFFREWMLSSLAIAYDKVKPAIMDREGTATIRDWFMRTGLDVMAFNEARLRRGIIDNHRYWGGLAVMATGFALGEKAMIDFGRVTRQIGLSQVQYDGTMPAELTRGHLSFHYHTFAFAPLASMMLLDPVSASPLEQAATARLAALILADSTDAVQGTIARKVKVTQSAVDHPALFYLLGPFLPADPPTRAALAALVEGVKPAYPFLSGNLSWLLTHKNGNAEVKSGSTQ